MNYLVTIQGHGDALISYMIAKNIKNEELVIICNNQTVSLIKYYINREKIISGEFNALYDIRKYGIYNAIKSLFNLISHLKKINKNDNIYFEKNDFRVKFIKLFIKAKIHFPLKSNLCLYQKRELLFDTKLNFCYNIEHNKLELNNKNIIIFPNSRIKSKEINLDSLLFLYNHFITKLNNVSILYFKYDNIPKQILNEKFIYKFESIDEMNKIIINADIIITADSLPLHVTYFLNKPLIPFYNNKINLEWLPPGVGEHLILYKKNKLLFSNSLSILWNLN